MSYGIVDISGRREEKLLRIEKNIRGKLRGNKKNNYDIGKLLYEAKTLFLDHGEYQRWIEDTFKHELPYSTAALYKGIYARFQNQPEMVQYLPVSLLMVMKQEEFPEEILKMIETDPEGFAKTVDVKKVKQDYVDYKKGKKPIYDIWADTGKDVSLIFDIVKDKYVRRQHDNRFKEIQMGFSKIDKGMCSIKDFSIVHPPSALREHYSNEFDKRISKLQEIKAAFMDAFDNTPQEIEPDANDSPLGDTAARQQAANL